MTASTQLVRYDAMCRAIAAAYKVDEVKAIRDEALAWEVYSMQAKNVEAERQACEIRLRAERKAGQLLQKMEKAKGGRDRNRSPEGSSYRHPSIRNGKLGITPKQAERWQKLAEVPDDLFERTLSDRTAKPTANGAIRANAKPKRDPVSQDALWLWGRLKDFDRLGLLDKAPKEVMRTMTSGMLDETHTLAPRVAAWLKRIGAL